MAALALSQLQQVDALLDEARPTELLLLLADSTPPLRQQLRLTFLELLRQRVLVLENRFVQHHPTDPVTSTSYLRPGPAFAHYQPRPYEALLLRPFTQNLLPEILLKHFVRLAFRAAQSAGQFGKLVRQHRPLVGLYKLSWWRWALGLWHLTPAGATLRHQLESQLIHYDATLSQLTQQDAAAATTLAAQLGGILLLLPTFQSSEGYVLDQELYRAQREQEQASGTDWSSGSSDGIDSWHDCGHHFDSHADSADSANSDGSGGDAGADAGCGGDSGCSGCGGCGGD